MDEERAYWLGFVAADGCVTRHKGNLFLGISLERTDRGHLDKLKSALGGGPRIVDYSTAEGEYSRISLYSKIVSGDLVKWGIVERKSRVLKSIAIPNDLKRHFYRGYVDGDGTISVTMSRTYRQWVVGQMGLENS